MIGSRNLLQILLACAVVGLIFGGILLGVKSCISHYEKVQTTGEVTSRDFHPSGCTTSYYTQKIGDSYVQMPQQNCWGDSWSIKVTTGEAWGGDPYTVEQDISEGDYNKVKIGDTRKMTVKVRK